VGFATPLGRAAILSPDANIFQGRRRQTRALHVRRQVVRLGEDVQLSKRWL